MDSLLLIFIKFGTFLYKFWSVSESPPDFRNHFGVWGAPEAAQTLPRSPRGHPGHSRGALDASQGSAGVVLDVPGHPLRLHFLRQF